MTDTMDSLELMSLLGSFCTYFLGQFLFVDSVEPGWKTFVSFIIFLVNFSVMSCILLIILGMASSKVKNMIMSLQIVRWFFPKKKRRFQNVKELDPNDLIGAGKVPLPRVLYPNKIELKEEKSNKTKVIPGN